MKKTFSTVITLTITSALLGASSLVLAQQPTISPEEEVRQTYQKISRAAQQGDFAAVSSSIADDALFVTSGKIATKQEALELLPLSISTKEKNLIKNRSILSAKVAGENAIVLERVWRSDGKQIDSKLTTTYVFAKRGQDWKLVTSSTSVD